MQLEPGEARSAIDAAIWTRYKKVKKHALKHVATAMEDVKNMRQVVRNVNAGVDYMQDEKETNPADEFMASMSKELAGFPWTSGGTQQASSTGGDEDRDGTGAITGEILESIHAFWIKVDGAFKEHGKKWHGPEFRTRLGLVDSTLAGAQKHNAKLRAFIDDKYEKVARAEGIKKDLTTLEKTRETIDACQARILPMQDQAKQMSDGIENARLDVERLEGHEIHDRREAIVAETTTVKQQLQSVLGKIEKSLRMFSNALDNDRFSPRGISRQEILAYLDDLFASLIKDGPDHPTLNIILDNLLASMDAGVQMKKDKQEKAISSIEAMRGGTSLNGLVRAYIDAQARLAALDEELASMSIDQEVGDAGRQISTLSSKRAALDADIARETKALAAARATFDATRQDIERAIGELTGKPVEIVLP